MNKLILNHLYSNNLNIYGDLGNILALKYWAMKMSLDLTVVNTEIGEKTCRQADLYFIGGGQDLDQLLVFKDLLKHKNYLQEEVKKNKIFLLVCGGLQLFGKSFIDGQGNNIEGLGILDMTTTAPDDKVASRSIGNVVVEMRSQFTIDWDIDTSFSKYLIGFENHGGQTRFSSRLSLKPIGKVIKGFGNNATDKVEGAWYKNIIGTYLHGSLLPKNPHLAVAIVTRALNNRSIVLKPEDWDWSVEKKAHDQALSAIGHQ